MKKCIMGVIVLLMLTTYGCLTVTYHNDAHYYKPGQTMNSELDITIDLKPGD